MADFPEVLSNVIDDVDDVMAKHINNLEEKVGIEGSEDPNSLDYKLRHPEVLSFKTNPVLAALAEGDVFWDYTNHCLAYKNQFTGSINQIGKEITADVCNNTGSPMYEGQVVYISGAVGVTEFPEVSLAIASDYAKSRIVGVLTTDIANGECGLATLIGNVNDLDTSTFNSGDIVYLSPTIDGGLTNTMPVDGNFVVIVGTVTNVSATEGRIFVLPKVNEFTTETLQSLGWSNDYGAATLSFVDATRTLSLSPVNTKFHFYQQGVKYEKTTDSIQLPNTEGLYIIYYNFGVLSYILNPNAGQVDSVIRSNPTVAYVYWDATNAKAQYVGQELHSMQFPALVHSYNHFAYGARYITGLGLTSLLTDQNGSLASHAQFGVAAGAIVDEDIYLPTDLVASTAGLQVFYLAGTSANPTLRSGSNSGYAFLTTGTGRPAYNFLTGGNWTIAEATNNFFVLVHVFANNENTKAKRVFAFMGQNQYSTLALAQAGAKTEINNIQIIGVVPQEMKSIGTVILECRDSYTNPVNARVRQVSATESYVDWRAVNTSGGGGGGLVGNQTSFSDAALEVYDDLDVTKVAKFQASAITTATTRTYGLQDKSGTLSMADDTELSTAKTTPADNDFFSLFDSAATNILKKITWGNIKSALNSLYQAVLVSGTNIKTINGSSVLGAGDLTVGGNSTDGKVQSKGFLTGGTSPSAIGVFQSLGNGSNNGSIKINIDGSTYDNLAVDMKLPAAADSTVYTQGVFNQGSAEAVLNYSHTVTAKFILTKARLFTWSTGTAYQIKVVKSGVTVATSDNITPASVGAFDLPFSGANQITCNVGDVLVFSKVDGKTNGRVDTNSVLNFAFSGKVYATITSMAEVATALQTAIINVTGGTETAIYSTNKFIISSGRYGSQSKILKLMTPSIGTDLSGLGTAYFDCATNATETLGTGSNTDETSGKLLGGTSPSALSVFQSLGAGADDGKVKINVDGSVFDNLFVTMKSQETINTGSTQNVSGIYATNEYWAQSFTVVGGGLLSTIGVPTTKAGSPSGSMFVALYNADSNDRPIGTPIDTKSVAHSAITTSFATNSISFNKYLPAGKYVVVIYHSASISGSNYINLFYITASNYSGGKRLTSTDSGVNWTDTTSDLYLSFNFSAFSFDSVAGSLQSAIRAITGKLETVVYSTNKFILSSATTGISSKILKLMTPTTGTDISGAGATAYLDCAANATEINGIGDSGLLVKSNTEGVDATPLKINAQTGTTYTLKNTDAFKYLTFTNASAIAVTIPTNATTPIPIGTEIYLIGAGAGKATLSGAGVTINSLSSNKSISVSGGQATLVKIATDTWHLYGNIIA